LRQISILGGCVKSAFGVATGLSFLTFCALHKKEIESTWSSRHGKNKDRQGVAQIYTQNKTVMGFIVKIDIKCKLDDTCGSLPYYSILIWKVGPMYWQVNTGFHRSK
jgi:hypothetical protein